MTEKIEYLELTDTELYEKFLENDKEAFNHIIKRYRKPLIAFLMTYVRNIEVAEDLAQDSFLYMIINKNEYDFKYKIKTYLYTIAKCRAINYIKRNKKIIKLDMQDLEIPVELNDEIERKEEKEIIYNYMKKLKAEYRAVIYLKEVQGFNYKEICKILNKTLPQVKSLIHRAKKKLEKIIREGENLC